MTYPNKFKYQIILIILLASFSLSFYIWIQAEQFADIVQSSDLWYELPELSRMTVRDAYELAFKKIILINAIVYLNIFIFFYIKNKK